MQDFIATLLAYIFHKDRSSNPPSREKKAAVLEQVGQFTQEKEET